MIGEQVMGRQERVTRARTDYVLVVIVAALCILGLMMVYSSTFDMAFLEYDNPNFFFHRQMIWMGLGAAAMIVLARIDYRLWQRWAILIMAGTLLMLGVVALAGNEKFGAARWLWNGSIQPSEVAKISVVIYIAAWIASKGDKIRKITYGLLPFAILIGLVAGLILLQRDLSTAFLIAVTSGLMFFFGGADLLQLFASLVFGLATFAFMIKQEPYRIERIKSFLNPMADVQGSAFQLNQALMALASGGVFGLGLGGSQQKYGYVPALHTDTIVAIVGEELGLIGCLVLLGLFVFLAYRGFKIALDAPDAFGVLLAAGLTCSLIIQALVNIAMVTATLPYAGITLPFISYGGSSLLTSMASVGLLLSISRGRRVIQGTRRASVDFGRRDRRARVSRTDRR
ncbi:MAG: putative lipid II flippase FtsW [Anaerolineae bacterium]|nr:putative lipid II flippase FtsW [Anaerolineae bacterium]